MRRITRSGWVIYAATIHFIASSLAINAGDPVVTFVQDSNIRRQHLYDINTPQFWRACLKKTKMCKFRVKTRDCGLWGGAGLGL